MDLQRNQPDKRTAPVTGGSPEAELRQFVDHFVEAIHDQDLEAIMACYADDVVAFDMMTPLQFVGKDAYRKSWQMAVENTNPDAEFTLHETKITASDSVGFCHSLCHCVGSMKDGQKMDMWMRWTDCFEKIDGKWLITHEQVSVPVDMESGKGAFNLRPEGNVVDPGLYYT
ncbi:nuclear transport factor 2 family protein [Bdellovibrio sp. NC01]|uniref:YybH family protein n=1 Tax=Bdellovibrio sp. NC01 TaxID=2220073 RepID=UPI00115BDA5A|nr:nuclear transport factor 2 family protein [Bdellovibrio sp. NC01]QDK37233.1 DUF4440 domain-containing protein [Bdellovibrio sp. NC01]